MLALDEFRHMPWESIWIGMDAALKGTFSQRAAQERFTGLLQRGHQVQRQSIALHLALENADSLAERL